MFFVKSIIKISTLGQSLIGQEKAVIYPEGAFLSNGRSKGERVCFLTF